VQVGIVGRGDQAAEGAAVAVPLQNADLPSIEGMAGQIDVGDL
jgi:hypothetical protein